MQILKVHLRRIELAAGVDVEQIAALTPGFSGADLANLANEAALLATRRGANAVGIDDFTAAVERIIAGLEKKNHLLNPLERRIIAHHEMGHALVALALPGCDPVHKVSIIPRGIGALGYTIQRPIEDRYLMTREELENRMAVLLGGRAAEEMVVGQPSTGAADDLAKVTDIARNIVMRYGMDPKLGTLVFQEGPVPLPGFPSAEVRMFSEHTAAQIDAAVQAIVRAALARSLSVLAQNRKLLDAGAAQLLVQETLGEADLLAFKDAVVVASGGMKRDSNPEPPCVAAA